MGQVVAFDVVRPDLGVARLLALIASATYRQSWTRADLDRLHPPKGFVLSDADQRLGLVLVSLASDDADILDIGIAPPARGQGLGGQLLAATEQSAKRFGAGRLVLEVAETNIAAQRLYARGGYREVGRRRDYYRRPDGSREDALVLSRTLSAL